MVVESAIETKFFAIDLPCTVKSIDEAKGEFVAYGSTYALDLQDDKIVPGAFARTLKEAEADRVKRGGQFLYPLLWMHDTHNVIGGIYAAQEDAKGLKIWGLVDLDVPEGRRAFSGMKKGYLASFSIGYKARRVSKGPYGVRNLEDISLLELSLVSFPANPEARVIGVKVADGVEALASAMIKDMERIAAKYNAKERTVKRISNPLTEAEQEAYHTGVVIFMDGEPGETRQDVIKAMQADARREDDIYQLHGKAFASEVALRKQLREKKQAEQKAALEQEHKEAAERHAAQSAPSFTPASFAAAWQLDEPFVRGRFNAWVSAGLVTPINESPLTLDGNEARRQARREWERFEARFLEMASRRVQGVA